MCTFSGTLAFVEIFYIECKLVVVQILWGYGNFSISNRYTECYIVTLDVLFHNINGIGFTSSSIFITNETIFSNFSIVKQLYEHKKFALNCIKRQSLFYTNLEIILLENCVQEIHHFKFHASNSITSGSTIRSHFFDGTVKLCSFPETGLRWIAHSQLNESNDKSEFDKILSGHFSSVLLLLIDCNWKLFFDIKNCCTVVALNETYQLMTNRQLLWFLYYGGRPNLIIYSKSFNVHLNISFAEQVHTFSCILHFRSTEFY